MKFSARLKESLEDTHLLKHPFYQDWNEGKLSGETLKYYAGQYYWHVDAFPRYISAAHSLCTDAGERSMLLENLNEEEGSRGEPHPELWLRFAEGVGAERGQVKNGRKSDEADELVTRFFDLCRHSYARALGALYAYEHQVPEVASTKIKGLKEHYGVEDDRTLSFFSVHEEADVVHREQFEELLDRLEPREQEEARTAAGEAGGALWNFLTAVHARGDSRSERARH